MKSTIRTATSAMLVAAALGLGAGMANAAPAGQFSPLKSIAESSSSAIEKVDSRWGRRCYRKCFVGRHGRTYCTWKCYRPHRWW